MTKKEFIKQFLKLSPENKQKVKQYHEDMLKGAIFIETYETAEKCLLWIQEAE